VYIMSVASAIGLNPPVLGGGATIPFGVITTPLQPSYFLEEIANQDIVETPTLPAGTYYIFGSFNGNCMLNGSFFQYSLSFYTGPNETGTQLTLNETNFINPSTDQNETTNFSNFGIVTLATPTPIYLSFTYQLNLVTPPTGTWSATNVNVGYIQLA